MQNRSQVRNVRWSGPDLSYLYISLKIVWLLKTRSVWCILRLLQPSYQGRCRRTSLFFLLRLRWLRFVIASHPLEINSLTKMSWSEYSHFLMIGKMFSLLIERLPCFCAMIYTLLCIDFLLTGLIFNSSAEQESAVLHNIVEPQKGKVKRKLALD